MLAVILAALAGLSYGSSDFTGAVASKDNDAALVTAAMQGVSLLAILAVIAVFPEDHRTFEDLAWAGLGGVGAAIGLTTFYIALARGPMTTAASITGLVGALVPLVSGLALGDRPGALAWVGIGVSVPAVVMLSVQPTAARRAMRDAMPRERVAAQTQRNRTRVLAVVAGLGFGLFFVALSRTSADAGLFPLIGARVASVFALSVVLTARRSWASITRNAWPLVLVAGILDCAANGFYLTALGRGTFVWVAAITSLYPVATVLLARVVLRERLLPVQVAGLLAAAGALALIAIGR